MAEPDLLDRYHARAGRTPVVLRAWRDDAGRSSYEVLSSCLGDRPRDHRILDLACGDGFLIERLRQQGFGHVDGLDRSEAELAAARERLGPSASLFHADARSTALPSASYDVVASHMALMLMDPVAPVLAEIARLCTPGGWLIAVLTRPLRDRAFEAFRRLLPRVTTDAGLEPLRLGDPRTMSPAGLRELLGAHAFDLERLRVHDFEVRLDGTPEALWSNLRMLYEVARLPARAQDDLAQRAVASWRSLAADHGRLRCAMGMRLVRVRTALAETEATARSP